VIGLFPGTRCGAGDGTQVFAARQDAQMVAADTSQAGDFLFGEDFLTRLDGDHFLPLSRVSAPDKQTSLIFEQESCRLITAHINAWENLQMVEIKGDRGKWKRDKRIDCADPLV
jgi:hypothetical protein